MRSAKKAYKLYADCDPELATTQYTKNASGFELGSKQAGVLHRLGFKNLVVQIKTSGTELLFSSLN